MSVGYYQAARPNLRLRIALRLGFGPRHLERPEDCEGFAPGYLMTKSVVRLDWKDRLRVLVGGPVVVEVVTQTDVPVTTAVSTSGVSILPLDGFL